MIGSKCFALKNSAAGSVCSPYPYHSGIKPRNGNQVHLKLIIILGRINWSYKKQEIVEIALLLSRQNIDTRFGFKWKRDSAGWGLNKQILRGLKVIKSGEMEKNIIKMAMRGLLHVSVVRVLINFIFRALKKDRARMHTFWGNHSILWWRE